MRDADAVEQRDARMRRGLSRRRGLSAVGARSRRRCMRPTSRARATCWPRRVAPGSAHRPHQHGRRARHPARRIRARGHAGHRSTRWWVLTSDRSFSPSRRRSKAAREGVPVVIVNPSTPVGPLDYKPTPTGRMIVDFLNRRMPAFMDTGLNLVDVEDARAAICWPRSAAYRREIYSRRREPDAGADVRPPGEAVGHARAEDARPVRGRVDSRSAPRRSRARSPAPPRASLTEVRMARKKMFFDSSKARANWATRRGRSMTRLRARSSFSVQSAPCRKSRTAVSVGIRPEVELGGDASAALDNRTAAVCVRVPGMLPVHRDRQLRLAHHGPVYGADLHRRVGLRMEVGAQRISVRALPLHRGDTRPRDLGRRRAVHGFDLVHLSVLCELHARAAAERAALPARARSAHARHLGAAALAAGVADGGAVHGDDRYGGRSAERARRALVSRQDFLVRPAGAAFRRADQQLPRMVFRRGGERGDFPMARSPAESRRRQTAGRGAGGALARAFGAGAVRRDRRRSQS